MFFQERIASEVNMNQTATLIKAEKKFASKGEHKAYSFGLISGYLICNYNHADKIALRVYANLLEMMKREAKPQEIIKYLEGTVRTYA